MVTVTKYLTKQDLRRKICDCENEEKLKVLFKEVTDSETEDKTRRGNDWSLYFEK